MHMVLKGGRNINNLYYANDTTLVAKNESDPEALLMKVKGHIKNMELRLHIKKRKLQTMGPETQPQK